MSWGRGGLQRPVEPPSECTELPLVLTAAMVPVPLLDPTQMLAEAVVREARAVPALGDAR